MKKIGLVILVAGLFSSCVGQKKFLELQENCSEIQITLEQRVEDLEDCRDEVANLRGQLSVTQTQLDNERNKSQTLQGQLD